MPKYYLLISVFFYFQSFAQTHMSDYVITINNDTLYGTVISKNIYQNKKIELKTLKKTIVYKPTHLKEVFYSGNQYVRLTKLKHKKIDTVYTGLFMKPIITDGILKLYQHNKRFLIKEKTFAFPIPHLKYYADDYDSTAIFLSQKTFQLDSVNTFVKRYNSFKTNNPSSQSFVEKNRHFKKFFNPQIVINFQGFFPSYHYLGVELGVSSSITLSPRLSTLYGRINRNDSHTFLPFTELVL